MIDDLVIIDDLEQDLTAITSAFAEQGFSVIPLNYREADDFNNACQKLKDKNIRVIITDMELQTSDLTGSDQTNAHAKLLTNILDKIISDEHQLYILIVWTTHKEQYDDFISIVNERLIKLKKSVPLFNYPLFKEDCKNEEGKYIASIILGNLNQYLEDSKHFKALLNWENNCKLAARDTVNILTEKADSDEIVRTLSSLAQQVNKKNLKNNEKYAIYEVMQHLLFDRVCYTVQNVDNKLWSEIIKSEKVEHQLRDKASLNTKFHLHIYKNQEKLEMIYPGDFLEITDNRVYNYLSEAGLPDFSTPSIWNDRNIRCLLSDYFNHNSMDKNNRKKCAEEAKIGLLEISPSCDFAQNKREPFKYYSLAILCPCTEEKVFEHNGSVFGNICIIYENKLYQLEVSAKFLFSITNSFIAYEEAGKNRFRKLFRIRQNFLNKLIQDIANHNSRIGTISFS